MIDAGGGIKSDQDLHIVFESGASMATGGSIAVKEPEMLLEWLNEFGSEKIILGSDFKEGRIAISGWEEETGEELIPFLEKWVAVGATKTICTDISKDGVLSGTSEDLYRLILDRFPDLYLIASGGVAGIDDILHLLEKGVPGVIVGKAIYEGKIDLNDLQRLITS